MLGTKHRCLTSARSGDGLPRFARNDEDWGFALPIRGHFERGRDQVQSGSGKVSPNGSTVELAMVYISEVSS